MWLVAAVAVVLLVLPWVIALAVAHHHHLDATAVAILAAVSIPLSALWVAFVTLAKDSGSADSGRSVSMAEIADQLAITVGTQWEAEAGVRRLYDPYPLPVFWCAADPSLTDTWDLLVKVASSTAGRPSSLPTATLAAGPDDLAGEGDELADVLARVPTGRLVVVGEPGAGKTMMMVRLVLDLLARWASGGPVPILVSIAAWNPVDQDLRDWLGAQLVIDYPALAAPPPTGREEPSQAAALLGARPSLILPILDGLDEIPEAVRGAAIARINDALRPGDQVLVTCRSQEYRDAIRPEGGVEVTLRAAAAIELRPLSLDAVRGYLCDDAAGPDAKARWAPVLAGLGAETPAGQALRTPLMVSLARAIYNPRPGELTGALRDPEELRNPDLTDRAAVESLLFDAFIPAAYRHDPAGRWKAQAAEKWLVFLARHLERTIARPDLAWWQLPAAIPGFAFVVGVLAGVAAGVAAGVDAGVLVGVMVGGLVGSNAGYTGLILGGSELGRRFQSRGRGRDPAEALLALGVVTGSQVSSGTGVVAGAVTGILSGQGKGSIPRS